jgi:hypothetical protein
MFSTNVTTVIAHSVKQCFIVVRIKCLCPTEMSVRFQLFARVKEDEMEGTYSRSGGVEKCIQNISRKT